MNGLLAGLGIVTGRSPLNLSFVLAMLACAGVWVYLWHTPWGYELRTAGQSERAAIYAGVKLRRIVIVAMCVSGALAGFVGVNEIMGVHHRLLLNFNLGYGFTGIAVALMGRNHPIGVVLASLLFGILSQGGAELAFEIPAITPEMIIVIQGLIILFSGALANLSRPFFERLFAAAGA
jgi:simple sugar transport system permease protein